MRCPRCDGKGIVTWRNLLHFPISAYLDYTVVEMSWFFGAVPYLLILTAAAVTVTQVLKDWHSYRHPTLRTAAVILVFFFAVLNLLGRYMDDRERRTESLQQVEAANRLETQVKATNEAQRQSFAKLSQMLSTLPKSCRSPDMNGLVDQLAERLRPKHYAVSVTESLPVMDHAAASKDSQPK